jgi:hypothetical protein
MPAMASVTDPLIDSYNPVRSAEFIDWTNGNDSSHRAGDEGPSESITFVSERLYHVGGRDDGWCIGPRIDNSAEGSYSGSHLLYQDVVIA